MRKTLPILALLAAALPARATLLDFEDLVGEDYGTVVGYGPAFSTHGFDFVETGDYRLDPVHFSSFMATYQGPGNYTGSVAIEPKGAYDALGHVALSASDGSMFDLEAIDLANDASVLSNWSQGATVDFVGTRADGSTVARSYTLSTGDALQTVTFSGFTGLTSVTFDQTHPWIQFDNIRVRAVPEPGTWAALGLGALGLLRRRKA